MKSLIVTVQWGCDQLMNILLIGWWCSKWESATSTFCFQVIWRLQASEQHTGNFSHLVGVSVSAQQLKNSVVCVPWWETRTLPQGCTSVSWLFFPGFCIPSLPWLATLWTCLLELREVCGSWMKAISCNHKGFCAQEPHRVLLRHIFVHFQWDKFLMLWRVFSQAVCL